MILSLDYSLIEDLESEFTIQIVLSAGDTQNIYFLTFQFEEEILENQGDEESQTTGSFLGIPIQIEVEKKDENKNLMSAQIQPDSEEFEIPEAEINKIDSFGIVLLQFTHELKINQMSLEEVKAQADNLFNFFVEGTQNLD